MARMKIIDIHTHVGDLIYGQPLDEAYDRPVWSPGAIFEWTGFRTSKPPLGFRTVTRYLEIIHNHHRNNLATEPNLQRYAGEAGITHAVLHPIEPVRLTEDNLALCRAANAAAGRPRVKLFTFASVSPRDPDRMAKLPRYMEQGCLGLKIHPIVQNLPLTDPAWFELVEAFRPYRKPILVHSGVSTYYVPYFKRAQYGDARSYEKLIAAFPEQVLILAHSNMAEPEVVWALAKKYANVYCDASFQAAAKIRRAFREMGEDRVLYGSDFPFSLPRAAVRVGMQATEGRPALREKFFGKNAEALIGPLPEVNP